MPPKSKLTIRNAGLDSLRGLAIVLMLTDHAVANWLGHQVATSGVRFWTRLSLPLFCVLMGYFLPTDGRFRLTRYGQILLSAVLVNAIYWPLHREFEVLVSLLIAAIMGTTMRGFAPAMLILLAVYPLDPLAGWFDYQLTLVLPLVGVGIVLRRHGLMWAIGSAAVLSLAGLSGPFIADADTHSWSFLFLLPATLLVGLAAKSPSVRLGGLDVYGRFPLTIYVTHFYVIAALAWMMGR